MPPLMFLIKPASGNCNMRCEYCFYADEVERRSVASYGLMDSGTAKSLIELALKSSERSCTFAFQGGEPTLSGLDFYKDFIKMVKEKNDKKLEINYAIQTNGIVIDEQWAKLFKENNFLVGISLDGPSNIHNMNRKMPDGSNTYNGVMKAIRILEKHEVDFNILTVVTSQTARFVESTYNFLQKNNLKYHQYIACLDPLEEERGNAKYSLTPKLYGDFLCKLFDLWYADLQQNNQPYIRYFENLVAMFMGQSPEQCGMVGVCTAQYVVESDGGVYPCDFYVTDDYLIGNVKENTIEEMNEKCLSIGFVEKSRKIADECKICKWIKICRGGCRRDRDFLGENGLGLNYFCSSYKRFFEYSYRRFEEIARIIMLSERYR